MIVPAVLLVITFIQWAGPVCLSALSIMLGHLRLLQWRSSNLLRRLFLSMSRAVMERILMFMISLLLPLGLLGWRTMSAFRLLHLHVFLLIMCNSFFSGARVQALSKAPFLPSLWVFLNLIYSGWDLRCIRGPILCRLAHPQSRHLHLEADSAGSRDGS